MKIINAFMLYGAAPSWGDPQVPCDPDPGGDCPTFNLRCPRQLPCNNTGCVCAYEPRPDPTSAFFYN